MSLCYVRRLMDASHCVEYHTESWIPIVVTSLLLGSKVWDDLRYAASRLEYDAVA